MNYGPGNSETWGDITAPVDDCLTHGEEDAMNPVAVSIPKEMLRSLVDLIMYPPQENSLRWKHGIYTVAQARKLLSDD